MRLYKGAGVCALAASLLWPAVFVLQSLFFKNMIDVSRLSGQSVSEFFKTVFKLLHETDMSPVYDMPHLPGMLILIPFFVFFSIVCFKGTEKVKSKQLCCIAAGIGLELYAASAFAAHLVMAVILYYREWSAGVSHEIICRILFTAFGSGIAELAIISLFALALLITGYTCSYRPFAVAAGAVCFYRLFEDSLWLFTGLFNGTLRSASALQIAHGVLFLAAMSLTFSAAVLVAMSSVAKDEEEGDRSL